MEATYNRTVDIVAKGGVPEHVHPHQDEHIEVLAGMVSVHIKGQERTYVAGESFDFPRNVPHCFLGAAGCEEARILWQIRPALDSETFFETVYGLAADGNMKERALSPQFKEKKMIHFERSLKIDATPDEVWSVLGNFMQVDEFAPEIVSVDVLTDGEDGPGSKRRNHFKNGTSLVEEITEWEPTKRRVRLQMLEMESMPLHEGYSTISVEPTDNGRSMVIWGMDFRAKYGPVGWLMGQTMMKMMMGKIIDGNLNGLADKVRSNRIA